MQANRRQVSWQQSLANYLGFFSCYFNLDQYYNDSGGNTISLGVGWGAVIIKAVIATSSRMLVKLQGESALI